MAWNIRDHELIECIEGGLRAVSLDRLPGDRYEDPELDVLLYLKRSLRLSGLPVIGRGLGIIGLIREPSDLQVETFEGASRIMTRATRAISTRFPPIRNGHGLAILSCLLITTSRPIAPHTETHLETLLDRQSKTQRAVVLGCFVVNPEQLVMAQAVRRASGFDYPEPVLLADALAPRFRRYVPLMPPDGS
jgi:hypothetical protein